jgi:hypothetical protein
MSEDDDLVDDFLAAAGIVGSPSEAASLSLPLSAHATSKKRKKTVTASPSKSKQRKYQYLASRFCVDTTDLVLIQRVMSGLSKAMKASPQQRHLEVDATPGRARLRRMTPICSQIPILWRASIKTKRTESAC